MFGRAPAPLRLTVLLACVVLMTGCDGGSTPAHQTPTATPMVTSTPQPVVITVSATAQGQVAQRNVVIAANMAIINNTTAPIAIVGADCYFNVPVILRLYDASGAKEWDNYFPVNSCPDLGALGQDDVQTIAAGGTYVWNRTDKLWAERPTLYLQAGIAYKLTADLLLWHQGDLSQIGTPTVPQGQDVLAQTTITFS
jgi:hypothetical protein